MPPDVIDLVDPIRLVILLLPEAWRAPVGAFLSFVVATQLIAAMIVARLPLAAREHPRWGLIVRVLHWYSVVRLRNELGSIKLPGATVNPRVTVAPVEVLLDRAPLDVPEAITPDRAGERGSVRFGVALYLAILVMLGGALAMSCHPPADCQAGRDSVRCSPTGVPQRCDTGGRWRSWATRPCSAVGRACLAANGRATCVSADAGVR